MKMKLLLAAGLALSLSALAQTHPQAAVAVEVSGDAIGNPANITTGSLQ
jgi:hypothetical protein